MFRPIFPAGLLLLSIVAVAVWAPAPSAQEGDPDAVPMGKLYLNATVLRADENDCGDITVYKMLPIENNNTTSRKATFGRSDVDEGSCGDLFEYNSTEAFQLNGTAVLHFWFGCNSANTVLRPEILGETVQARLLKNDTELDTGTWDSGEETCGTNTGLSANITFETKDAEFNASEPLRVEITHFAQSGANNVHFKVEAKPGSHNSSLRARGLPIPAPIPTSTNTAGSNTTTEAPANTTAPTNTTTPTNTTEPTETTPETTEPTFEETTSPPTSEDTGEPAGEGGRSPGPGFVVVLIAMLAVGATAARRRRSRGA
ncbi:MAG: hypothetical protein HYT80_02200 [Euryarchaeota archaeon]|nr:hypothetical protein [Euryarchaeota archaeon]